MRTRPRHLGGSKGTTQCRPRVAIQEFHNPGFLREVAVRSVAFFFTLWVVVGCSSSERWESPNIVLISLDTLRADHTSIYGYPKEITPHLAQLAREAAIFDNGYTPASHTLLAHASMMTALYPETHGVIERSNTIASDDTLLAQVLHQAGYRTVAFINGGYLDPKYGFDRGFDVYDFAHDIKEGRSAEVTNQAIFEWLSEYEGRPFFLFAHYFDIHSDWEYLPYESAPTYKSKFVGPAPDGFRAGDGKIFASRFLGKMNKEKLLYTDAERDYVKSLYDAGIAYTDFHIGALIDKLREVNLLDRTIIIIVSDHGEEFQEHGNMLHTQVFEEVVRIPFLISFPEMRGSPQRSCRTDGKSWRTFKARRIETAAELVDLMPTIADCIGIPISSRIQGQSLMKLLEGDDQLNDRPVFVRNSSGSQMGIRKGKWKLIHAMKSGRSFLYDLKDDPGERENLAKRYPERAEVLLRELESWREESHLARSDDRRDVEVSDEVIKALEALGYVEGKGE